MSFNKRLVLLVFSIIAIYLAIDLFNRGPRKKELRDIKNNYSRTWVDFSDHNKELEIARVLVATHTGGCGSVYVKDCSVESNIYAIACTSDLSNFKYYIVRIGSSDIIPVKNNGNLPPSYAVDNPTRQPKQD